MKVYTIIVLLFSVMCAHAMDTGIISLVRRRHNNRDIFFKDSKKLNNGCLDELPLELHGKIIKDIFNLIVSEDKQSKKHINQAILERCGLVIPIVLGVKLCDEFFQMQDFCRSEIGGKKFLTHELFVLPRKEKEAFVHMAEYSLLASGNIRSGDYEIILKMSQENIKKGLNLEVNLIDENLDYINNFGFVGCSLGLLGQLGLQPFFGCISPTFFFTGAAGSAVLFLLSQTAILFNHEDLVDWYSLKIHKTKTIKF